MASRRRTPPPKRPRKPAKKPARAARTKPSGAKAKAAPKKPRAAPKTPRAPRKPKSGGTTRKTGNAKPRAGAKSPARRRLGWRIAKWSLVFVLWLVVLGAAFVGYYAHDLPDTEHLTGPETPLSITVLAADGSEVATVGEMWGELVPVQELAPVLPQAVLAIEDRRFYTHGGIDAFGVIRAAWQNAVEGRVVAGGSTISQQVAKLVFLSPERTVRRKIQEAMLAFWLEREFTKEEILTIYLNRAYFGAGAYGVDAAARRYFGRSARDVDVAQAAMIAGLLKAPSRYSPANDLALARKRAGLVLDAMVDAGFLSESEGMAASGRARTLTVAPRSGPSAGYFVDWVREQVPGYVGRDHGALRVFTTLEPKRQRAAQAALAETLAAAGTSRKIGQGALVALDENGAVRAMVGGRDHATSVFNRATQARRQPGSAFKTVVYLAGIEAGLAPDDRVDDAPITVGGWSPRNYDDRYRGTVTVREGFARSINTVAVRVGLRAGVKRIRETARGLGIESTLPADASIALGTGEVTLLELTSAYVALANGGARVLPHGIAEIRNRAGDVLYGRTGSGAGRAAEGPAVAAMRDLLGATVAEGTGRNARLPQRLGRAYGKTGTSQRFRDAWFVGWAGGLTTGVWLGNDDGSPMDEVTGGSYPAEIWRTFMVEALR
ncbi:MAG: PBP1A family penicillin-binding protein [Rhodospirillaceae bacterium]|nr:PBP1A family penicillin-binding protein [Rhodospirillaceae bacterium]